MRILHVVSSVDPKLGGVAESIRSRGVKLVEMGHSVEVVCLDGPGEPFIRAYELVVHALGPGLTKWQFHRGLLPWLKSNFHRFDFVVVDGIWQYHGLATRMALKGTNVPYFVFTHGMLDPWFKKTFPLKHLKKWLFWPWADYRVLRDAASVFFTCEEERIRARQSFWLYSLRERVVPFGTDCMKISKNDILRDFLGRHPELANRRNLVFLGRIHRKKGCDLLVEAMPKIIEKHGDVNLLMVGPGEKELLDELKEASHRLSVSSSIKWFGMLIGDEKWAALSCAEAFVLPSHQENFGMAVAEALSCGVPVLISNKVNIWREVEIAGAGLVFDDTAQDVAESLLKYLSLSKDQLEEMRLRAFSLYDKNFTLTAMATGLLDATSSFVEPRRVQ